MHVAWRLCHGLPVPNLTQLHPARNTLHPVAKPVSPRSTAHGMSTYCLLDGTGRGGWVGW